MQQSDDTVHPWQVAEAQTSCLSCQMRFHVTKRVPRLLGCLHAICDQCVQDKMAEGVIACPSCSLRSALPSGAALRTDIRALREVHATAVRDHLEGRVALLCDGCGASADDDGNGGNSADDDERAGANGSVAPFGAERVAATWRCVTCMESLCDACHAQHARYKRTRDHQTISLARTEHSAAAAQTAARCAFDCPCPLHPDEALMFYSETCGVPICRECAVTHHSQDDFCDAATAHARARPGVEATVRDCARRIPKLERAVTRVAQAQENAEAETEAVRAEIGSRFDRMEAALRARRAAALSAIDDGWRQKQVSLQTQHSELATLLAHIRHVASRANAALLQAAPPAELLSMLPLLTNRAEQLAAQEVEMEPAEDALPALPHGFSAKLSAIAAHVTQSAAAFDAELRRIDSTIGAGAVTSPRRQLGLTMGTVPAATPSPPRY